MKKTTLPITNSISCPPLRRVFVIIAFASFALSRAVQAQLSPTPDGGYKNGNTAEGTDPLFSLTTGRENTATGFAALFSNAMGDFNTAYGFKALATNTATGNTATGWNALLKNDTGFDNTASGMDALATNTSGGVNTAIGAFALFNNMTTGSNTAIGFAALFNNTASRNIGVGEAAGANLTTGDDNIDIGNQGVDSDETTIRIGTEGTQTKTFIAGIKGETSASGIEVFINSSGQLGTSTSSKRFKEDIRAMDKASEAILALKPVTFRYKREFDPQGIPQFGLVAEDVQKVNPALVVLDKEGKPYAVRYEQVNAMLLNEFLKEHRKMEEQAAMIAKQQKQIEALTKGLQKVSAQVEMSKPAPQTVLNQ